MMNVFAWKGPAVQKSRLWNIFSSTFVFCLPLLCLLAGQVSSQEKLISGVTFRTYLVDSDLFKIPQVIPDQTPNAEVVKPTIDWSVDHFSEVVGNTYSTVTGFLKVDQDGVYRFRLTSDDGSRLLINKKRVCNHDDRHGATSKVGEEVALKGGVHALLVEHFDSGGGRSLKLEWQKEGATKWQVIPEQNLLTEDDPTRVTSPGFKKLVGESRPGDRRPLRKVHPSWRIETIRPDGFEPKVGALAMLPDGRLLVGTFDPLQRDEISLPDIGKKKPDSLFAVSGLESSDPKDWKVSVIAKGFFEPAGACVVGNDVYVSHRGKITRIQDQDGDGFYESMKDIASGWDGWNYHQFTFSVLHRGGKLYAALSTTMAPPAWEGMGTNAGPCGPHQGSVIEIDLASDTARVIAGGMRTPNGLGFGPEGALFYADNQGTWMSTSQFAEVVPGRFYGHYNRTNIVPKLMGRYPAGGFPSSFCDQLRVPPTLWLPQNEVCNSPTQSLLIEDGEFRGQMLLGELTAGGLRRLFLEKVRGEWQGALFRHSQGFEAGINRMVWGNDGSLYVGGLGAGGNWNWRGTQFGLQRMVPVKKSVFEMKSMKILAEGKGFDLEFTRPIAEAWLVDEKNFKLSQWRYVHTKAYGGPKIDTEDLVVTSATPLANGMGVRLKVEGLKKEHCVYLVTDPKSAAGEEIWSTEAWYTLNHFPQSEKQEAKIDGTLITDQNIGLGAFPGPKAMPLLAKSAYSHFKHGENKSLPNDGRRPQSELINLSGEFPLTPSSGNLVTSLEFGDCRLHVEWFAPTGGKGQENGNSGLYIQNRYEIQVLATAQQEKPIEFWEAGSIYRFKAPDHNASTGPGTWQSFDLWFKAPRFENKKKVSDARMTLFWNGVLVHNDVAVPHATGARKKDGEDPSRPIQLGPL
ncbi:MAG: hypothetical protein ACI97A_004453, partial [Planctomycetota bacterium]